MNSFPGDVLGVGFIAVVNGIITHNFPGKYLYLDSAVDLDRTRGVRKGILRLCRPELCNLGIANIHVGTHIERRRLQSVLEYQQQQQQQHQQEQ
jgi:hypothetical protein